MRTIRTLGAAAVVMVAAACSSPASPPVGPTDPVPAASPAAGPTPAPTRGATSGAAGTSSAPPADTRRLSSAELEQVLLAVRGSRGLDARLVGAAELEAQAEAARTAIGAAGIQPEACAALAADEVSAMTAGDSVALLVTGGAGSAAAETVAVVSSPDPLALAGREEAARRLLAGCSEFTMTVAGRTVTTRAEAVEVPGSLPGVTAVRTVAEGAGQQLQTLSVSSVRGHHRVQVSVTSPADPGAAVGQAAELIKAVHAELARLP